MRLHIKKNDEVVAIAGADAGKRGKIMRVEHAAGRVLVEGLNVRKKCLRKSQENPQGGIIEREFPLAACKVQLYCPPCKRGVRIKIDRSGEKPVRRCVKCGHTFEG